MAYARKKRCRKGKSCGSTCIFAQKVCLIDLGPRLSKNLGKVSGSVSSANPSKPAPLPERLKSKLDSHIKDINAQHSKLRDLEKENLPSGELWRVKEVKDKLKQIRGEIQGTLAPFADKEAALSYVAKKEKDHRKTLYKEGEIEGKVRELTLQIRADRKSGKDYTKLWNKTLDLIGLLDGDAKRRASIMAKNAIGQRLKIPIDHSLKSVADAQKAGSDYLKQFSGLNKVVNLLDRYSKVRETMVQRLKDPSLPAASRAALEKRMAKVLERRMFYTERLVSIMSEIREGMIKTNLSDKQVNDMLARVWMINQSSGIVRGHAEEFIRMFNGRGFSDYGDDKKVKSVRSITDSPERAKAVLISGSIYTNVNKATTFHELAHIVESQRPWMTDFAVTWRNGKGVDSAEARELTGRPMSAAGWQTNSSGKAVPAFRLNQFASSSYRDDETAVVGKFYHPYMGKVYAPSSGSRQLSTEVWSMAFEQFSNVQSMAKFYAVHPDLFEAVVGLSLSP